MKKLLLYALPLGLIISVITLLSNNSYSQQTSSVKTTISSNSSKQTSQHSVKNIEKDIDEDSDNHEDHEEDDVNFTSSHSQISSNSDIQRNSLNINAADLKQPHILKINSSNAKLQGQIKINGKVVRRLKNNQSEINLSPYLSRGQQKVEISGSYTPVTASVTVEMKSADNNISQQTSGNGILNYTLDLNVQ
ncbi:hypothetical protein NIES4071_01170 [Calothrix sp. NIES-4071]|nr:hypothetical protein NIES4071_01170 [Calothrix sp. NIES-4071]BAZ54463.1 hypothetical protein NIES4105_01160 [Calothrix sp. NIES-4105]